MPPKKKSQKAKQKPLHEQIKEAEEVREGTFRPAAAADEKKSGGVIKREKGRARVAPYSKSKRPKTKKKSVGSDEEEESFVPGDLSAKILKQATEQQDEEFEKDDDEQGSEDEKGAPQRKALKDIDFSFHNAEGGDEDEEEEEMEEIEIDENDLPNLNLSEAEQKSLSMFAPANPTVRGTLADLILEKIKEKERAEATSAIASGGMTEEMLKKKLPPKVVQVYTEVAHMMKIYTSGKIPKAFKIIPSLKNWEEVLYLTCPGSWSAQAMSRATRLFASNLNSKMAQRFFNLVLLQRIRDDIAQHKKLNYHLYQSLIKAVFKPAAFFKGMVLPLADDGCSPREAVIFSSVLSRASIPAPHAAVAILKLSQMPYSGPCVLFIKTLLNKKYSLPYRVIDAMVKYLAGFAKDERKMPVIWHQTLLVFVQRFKSELTTKQREAIKVLTRFQTHPIMTEEVRRELFAPVKLESGDLSQLSLHEAMLREEMNRKNAQASKSRRGSVARGGGKAPQRSRAVSFSGSRMEDE